MQSLNKKSGRQSGVAPVISALGRLRQEHCELKVTIDKAFV
jgi:hypothetical protein